VVALQPNEIKSKWSKPDVYITIVVLYLTISLGIWITATSYGFFVWQESIKDAWTIGRGLGLVQLVPIVTFGWLFFISIPTVIGIVQLARRKKSGVYISFFSLILIAITMFFHFGFFISDTFERFYWEPAGTLEILMWVLLIGVMIVSTSIMYLFLILGKKRVEWK